MALVWLAVAIMFGVIEVATVAFFAAFIAAGAAAAAVAALLGAGVAAQVVVFVAVSLLGVLGLRPYALRSLRSHGRRLVSGAPAMIGQQALVVDEIQGAMQPGHVLISGERWPAVTANGISIAAGQTVVVDGGLYKGLW